METFDLYDRNRIPLGKTGTRGVPLGDGEYRLAVHVCIFNAKGQMLIQQRARDKNTDAGMWDLSAGGGALCGEDSRAAAERETREELGIALDLTEPPHLTVTFDEGFNDMYLIERNVQTENLRLQKEEVQAVKWATQEEIFAMIEAGTFIPYYPSLIALLFEKRKYYGGIRQRKERI